MSDYKKCFVYQNLTYICHGAGITSEKFRNVCLYCPCFIAWLEKRESEEIKKEDCFPKGFFSKERPIAKEETDDDR